MEQRQQRNYRWACHQIRLKLLWVVTGKYETQLAKKLSHLKQGEGIKRKANTTWSARHWGEWGKGGRGQQPSHLARHITHMHIYECTISLPPSQTHAHRLINVQLSFLKWFCVCLKLMYWHQCEQTQATYRLAATLNDSVRGNILLQMSNSGTRVPASIWSLLVKLY